MKLRKLNTDASALAAETLFRLWALDFEMRRASSIGSDYIDNST